MTYGTIKVDTVTFTDAGVDKSVTLSGLVQNPTFSGNVTVTGTLSGVTVTGTTANFTSGNFTNISGGTHTITSGVFAAGSAASPSITFTGDLNTGIYSPGADQVAISTGGAGRLFVDGSGRVGVGISNPSSTYLHVYTTAPGTISAPTICLEGGVNGYGAGIDFASRTSAGGTLVSMAKITADGEAAWNTTASTQDANLRFFTAADGSLFERLRITSAGLVGVGTSSPASLLTSYAGNVSTLGAKASTGLLIENNGSVGNISQIGLGYTFSSTNHPIAIAAVTTSGAGSTRADLVFATRDLTTDVAPTERMRIDSSGRVGIGTTSPGFKCQVDSPIALSGSGNDYYFVAGNTSSASRRAVALGVDGVGGNAVIAGYNTFSPGLGTLIVDGSDIQVRTGSTERARIDSSGRLLVGTSSSSAEAKFIVQGGATAAGGAINIQRNATTASAGSTIGYISFANSANDAGAFISADGDGTWSAGTSHPTLLKFSTTADGASSPTERMKITRTGEIYVFCASGAWNHSANNGSGAGTESALYQGRYGATDNTGTTGTRSYVVWTNGNVQNTNNSYTAISDIKLKENIVDAGSQWADIKSLQVRNYNLKEGQTHRQIGLIAQEVEPISPGLVYESPDRDAEGNDLGTVTKSVNYSVLYMKAVKALQEAMERIETLEASNTDLLARVSALESA